MIFFAPDLNYHDLNTKQNQIGYQLDHQINDNLTFSQKTRYGKYNDYLKSLITWYSAGGSDLVRKARIFDYTNRSFQTDNSLHFKTNTGKLSHSIMAGVDFTNIDRQESTYLGDAPNIDWQATSMVLLSTNLRYEPKVNKAIAK